jgi:NO-binding membrane sensor protein with MHYT domain
MLYFRPEGEPDMAEIHHLEHGWVTPTVSYLLSVLGSLLGLVCAVRLRSAPSTGWRAWWLGLAALAIGGTGIWTMHFVAMLGFSVVGANIRYDVPTTAISAVIAVIAVGIGLAIVSLGARIRRTRIVIGGVLTGLGVAAMHYTGMFAMRLDGEISYADVRVGVSIAIAVVAATVALWLAITVRGTAAIVVSALIMGVAVNGMHFTGMSAMSVRAEPPTGTLNGASASSLLIPIGVAVLFGVLGLLYALMAAPTDEDRAALAYLEARRAGATTAEAAADPLAGAFPATTHPGAFSPDARPGEFPEARPGAFPAARSSAFPAGAFQVPRTPDTPGTNRTTPNRAPQTPNTNRPAPDQAADPVDPAVPGDPATPAPGPNAVPGQRRSTRRMPTFNSSWTYRDRTGR